MNVVADRNNSLDGQALPRPSALITGAAGGIGGSFAKLLAQQGYRLYLVDRDADALARVAESLNGDHATVVADVSSAEAWSDLAQRIESDAAQLGLLVNCAGFLLAGRLAECQPEQIERLVGVNLVGTMHGCRAMVPLIAQSDVQGPLPRGVINVASIFAAVSPPQFSVYSASKAGVVALTESLRGELHSLGLTATVVLPGVTPTGLFDRAEYTGQRLREAIRDYLDSAELTPDQVAEESIEAYRRGRATAVIGQKATWYARLKRLMPERLIQSVAKRFAQQLD